MQQRPEQDAWGVGGNSEKALKEEKQRQMAEVGVRDLERGVESHFLENLLGPGENLRFLSGSCERAKE